MKNIILALLVITIASCGNNLKIQKNSVIGKKYKKFKEIDLLSHYKKISDTIIYVNNLDPKHGILHLQDQNNNLIIFKSIQYDSTYVPTFKIIDTLVIPNLNKPELITIGYCQINEDNNENLIAIVDKTDSHYLKSIKKAWLANTESKKIESVKSMSGISCFNEWYVE